MIAFFVVDKFTLVLIMHQIKNSKYNKTYIIPNLQNVKKYILYNISIESFKELIIVDCEDL